MNPVPFTTVVICSKDRHPGLEKAVEHVRRIDYPGDSFEIVVVEEEGPQAAPVRGVRYHGIPRKNLGLGYARNVGASLVDLDRSRIVAFCDDDEVVDAQWLKELVRAFEDPQVYGVGGLVRSQDPSMWGGAEEILGVPGGGIRRLVNDSSEAIVPTRELSGANFAYLSKVFREFKFPESPRLKGQGEDYYMAEQVGKKYALVFNPKAVVYHEPRGSFRRVLRTFEIRQIRDYLGLRYVSGRNRFAALLYKGPRLMFVRCLAAVVLAAWGGAGMLFLLATLYYVGSLLSVRRVYRYVGRRSSFFFYPALKLAADMGVLLGELACLNQFRKSARPLEL